MSFPDPLRPAVSLTSPDDTADWLARCALGDRTAFEALRARELSLMLALVAIFIESAKQREQVVHDALALGWKNAGRYGAGSGSARGWLWRILCSRLANQLRAADQWPPAGSASPVTTAAGAPIATAETACIVAAAHQRLSPPLPLPVDPAEALPVLAEQAAAPAPSRTLLNRLDVTVASLQPGQPSDARPAGETIFAPLQHPSLRWPIRRARWQYHAREAFKRQVGRPIEDFWFHRWRRGQNERLAIMGLPRRSIEAWLGSRLELMLQPGALLQSISFPDRIERRRLSNQFIWDGDWDRRLSDIRTGRQYAFIDEIWRHRLDLTASAPYRKYAERLAQGRPYESHHKGIHLDSHDSILTYLRIYHLYLEDMACFGFDARLGKDRIGVAINRHGGIVKINKGLHRLAMAQVLGLEHLPVRVRGVHRQWWETQTRGLAGEAALEAMAKALPYCRPAPLAEE